MITGRNLDYSIFISTHVAKSTNNVNKGHTYDLKIYKDDLHFSLAIPPCGVLIQDDFEGMYSRSSLYNLLEDGEIFKWLIEVHEKIKADQVTSS